MLLSSVTLRNSMLNFSCVFINLTGTWRVGGVLAVSRAFGDKFLKPYVVAEPEIQVINLKLQGTS